MKEKMDKKSIEALAGYRLQRSDETMREAEILFNENCYNATINRLYYACYYAVSALLLKNGIFTQTHSGVKSMLGLHFVSQGKLSVKMGTIYYTLFEKRQSGDYDDFIFFDKEMTKELIEKAKMFIMHIKQFVEA